ncbi:hypothetical protein KIM372_14730 [Bombiscardovia nodaiensis]|uniref:Sortase n=1 Tax=Bombiscardovia nodaiensis TaxID=2932181 RepID=A0ABM8B9R6_9BIFI|nr:hypothetical protein KIM372_14730 [Bombiscardovia nodaiensis]
MFQCKTRQQADAVIAQALERDPSLARSQHPHNWILNLVTLCFVCLGIGIFTYPLAINYANYRQQTQAINTYERQVAKLTPQEVARMWADAVQYNVDLGTPTLKDPFTYQGVAPPLDRYLDTLNVDGEGMMAYLEAPKIQMKLPIYHGTSDQVLLKGGGHIVTTQLPTSQTSVHPVLTGHTGSIGHLFFDNITQLREGDIFQLTVLNRHMSYRVDQIKIIEPTDTSAIQPEYGKNWVTLLTCYPYGINSHRYLVRGEYIGDNVAPTRSPGVPIWVLWALLITLLLASIGAWLLLARRRECSHELNARKAGQRSDSVDVDSATDAGSASETSQAHGPPASSARTRDVREAGARESNSRTQGPAEVDSPGQSSQAQDRSETKAPEQDPPSASQLSFWRRRAIWRTLRYSRASQAQLLRSRRLLLAAACALILLALVCAWAAFGLMMRTGFLPIFDLGYSWFDQHIIYFFDILPQATQL